MQQERQEFFKDKILFSKTSPARFYILIFLRKSTNFPFSLPASFASYYSYPKV